MATQAGVYDAAVLAAAVVTPFRPPPWWRTQVRRQDGWGVRVVSDPRTGMVVVVADGAPVSRWSGCQGRKTDGEDT